MVIGLAFHHWLVPLLLPFYLVLLAATGAGYYTRLLNETVVKPDKVAGLTWARTCPKPLFSFFLYEIMARQRVTYLLTKVVSVASGAWLSQTPVLTGGWRACLRSAGPSGTSY
jgi:hypothetical protein